jgi:hypothetical protein
MIIHDSDPQIARESSVPCFKTEAADENRDQLLRSSQAPLRASDLRFFDQRVQRVDRLENMRPRRESNPPIAVLRTAAFPLGYVAVRTVIVRSVVFAAFELDTIDLPCHET